jgi:hypothetical protein
MSTGIKAAVPQKAKLGILFTLLLLAIVPLPGCSIYFFYLIASGNDEVPQDRIVVYVNTNYEALEAFPYDEMPRPLYVDPVTGETYEWYEAFSTGAPNNLEKDKPEDLDQLQSDFIKKHLGRNTIVKGIYAQNENILEFYCGGSGLVTGSTSTGFYYSRDDTPFAMEFNCELTETSPGIFEWQNEDGSHRIYTEKIRDNWYYYIQDYY